MRKIYLLLIIISVITLSSCSDNNPVNSVVATSEGVFLLSEGSFSPNTSRLSYYNSVKDSFNLNVFNPSNLGLYPDGIIKYNNMLFITEQGNFGSAGKIYMTDMNATVQQQKSVGTNPYSLCAANGKIYITNGPSSKVSVVNASDLSTIKEISVGAYPQEIMSYNNRVFVCNTSVYGGASDSTISVIDAGTDAVVQTLKVDIDPVSVVVTNNNKLLVASWSNSGRIYEFETITFTQTNVYTSPYGFMKEFCADRNANDVYFVGYDNDIIRFNLDTKQFSKVITKPTANSFIYGYVYDYIGGRHYLADAKNFVSNGAMYVYDSGGNFLKEYPTGVAPRRFLVNKQYN